MDDKKILETLKLQHLSEEEKASRHILGRLYGPIATCSEATRNGRFYSKKLWEQALNDEVFKEKIANKSVFLELGHPADREETDMEKVCACIPELPKLIGDDLYAYIDILDTPNGRLLKKLCDYGFKPGISSRASGDVLSNQEVDPDTFYLETWDIVQLPAVKKARLSVCESFDADTSRLSKALQESYNKSSKKEKALMEDALSKLNMKINIKKDNSLTTRLKESLSGAELKQVIDLAKKCGLSTMGDLEKFMKDNKVAEKDLIKALGDCANGKGKKLKEAKGDKASKVYPGGTPKNVKDIPFDEEDVAESLCEADEEEVEEADSQDTIGNLVEIFSNYDEDTPIIYAPVSIDGIDYNIQFYLDDTDKDSTGVIMGVELVPVEGQDDNKEDKADDDTEPSAEDAGEVEEVVESLKESLKEAYNKIKHLRRENAELRRKAVGDTKDTALSESLEKYKGAFMRTSKLAAKNEKEVQKLSESVKAQKDTITTLKRRVDSQRVRLAEQAKRVDKDSARLNEQLQNSIKEANSNIDSLSKELASCKKQLSEKLETNKALNAKLNKAITKYVETKANMLGVKPKDITSRLDENYTLDDIDKVCKSMLTESVPTSRLPIGIKGVDIKTNKSLRETSANKQMDPEYGYEIDDDLLTLAGLK